MERGIWFDFNFLLCFMYIRFWRVKDHLKWQIAMPLEFVKYVHMRGWGEFVSITKTINVNPWALKITASWSSVLDRNWGHRTDTEALNLNTFRLRWAQSSLILRVAIAQLLFNPQFYSAPPKRSHCDLMDNARVARGFRRIFLFFKYPGQKIIIEKTFWFGFVLLFGALQLFFILFYFLCFFFRKKIIIIITAHKREPQISRSLILVLLLIRLSTKALLPTCEDVFILFFNNFLSFILLT